MSSSIAGPVIRQIRDNREIIDGYTKSGEQIILIEEDGVFLERVLNALTIARKVYSFSDLEKEAAPLLYKCIRPLWWAASEELKEAGNDKEKIERHLDKVEFEQTRRIEFSKNMYGKATGVFYAF